MGDTRDAFGHHSTDASLEPLVEMRISTEDSARPSIRILWKRFPVHKFRHLHIEGMDYNNLTMLHYFRLAAASPVLEILVLENMIGPMAMAFIAASALPSLCELTLRGVNFHPAGETQRMVWDYSYSPSMCVSFLTSLS